MEEGCNRGEGTYYTTNILIAISKARALSEDYHWELNNGLMVEVYSIALDS